MPASRATIAQASSSAPNRSSAPGPDRTAANFAKQQPSPASLAGPQWQTAKPASRLSWSHSKAVSPSERAVTVRISPLRSDGLRADREGHDRRQKAWVKAELAVQPDMLGALSKGEEPGMAVAPSIQLIAGCGDEALPDAAVPQIGPVVSGPKNPTLPQRVAKFDPTSTPSSSSAAKAAVCSAPNLPYT